MTNYDIPNYTLVYYSDDEIIAAIRNAGFPTSVVDIMRCIGYAESSGSNAVQKNQPYATTGWGLFQITPGNSVSNVGVDSQLLDINTNAKAAYAKYVRQGLSAWVTYNNGKYKDYESYRRASANDTTTAHPITPAKSFSIGSTGPGVFNLKRVLNAWYPGLVLDLTNSTYDIATSVVVAGMQARAGLTVSGIADSATLTRLGIS